jgi:cytochrome c oxidase cbb3-type subunit I/II
MPPYPGLAEKLVDLARTEDKLRALRAVGVPYDPQQLETARPDAEAQGAEIAKSLRDDGVANANPQSEIVALTAYLQRLGTHAKAEQPGGPRVSSAK